MYPTHSTAHNEKKPQRNEILYRFIISTLTLFSFSPTPKKHKIYSYIYICERYYMKDRTTDNNGI